LHQQWPVAPDNLLASHMLSCVDIAPVLQQQILQMAQQLTRHYQLRGLNSLDVLIHRGEQQQVYCLELNPRLSASVDLYQTTPPLMQLHLQGLQGQLPKQVQVAPQARARSIVYAQQRMQMGAVQWPSWVSDIPLAGSQIEVGQPIFTVQAQHELPASCWQMLEQRVQSLSEWLLLQHQ
jgi:predicted ATP-grasp superfamily ATP-dependent carboligase